MAGTVLMTDRSMWSHRSGVFYWVVETLAERVHDVGMAERLWEISNENLGCLDLADFTPEQQSELFALIAMLPEVARVELPDTEWREPIAESMTELAGMVASS